MKICVSLGLQRDTAWSNYRVEKAPQYSPANGPSDAISFSNHTTDTEPSVALLHRVQTQKVVLVTDMIGKWKKDDRNTLLGEKTLYD